MGKFHHFWKPSEDGEYKDERCFARFAACITIFCFAFMCFVKHDNLLRWISAGFTIKKQEKQIENLIEENTQLENQIRMLTNDRDSIEKYARERFLFSAPGEDVYIFED